MNRLTPLAAVCVLTLALPARGDGPKLVDKAKVFGPDELYEHGGRAHGLGYMRLSPDGQRVLCIRRQAPAPTTQQPGREISRLVLRDLAEQKDRLLPIPPCDWEEILVKMVSRNVFDPSGATLALARGAATDASGVFQIGKAKMQAVIYTLATGQARSLAQAEELVLPQFDRAGTGLIIMTVEKTAGRLYRLGLPDLKLQRLRGWGMPMLPCPTGEVVPLFYRDREKEELRFILYDLQGDRELASLPVHPSNTLLEEVPAQWTPDGRYLYYCDLEDPPDDKGRARMVTRVYEVAEREVVATVDEAFPVGGGPMDTATVVLAQAEKEKGPVRLVLHEADSGKAWTLAEAPVRVFYAGGGKVLYGRASGAGRFTAMLAEIQVPAGTITTRPAATPAVTTVPESPGIEATAPVSTRPAPIQPTTRPVKVGPPAPRPSATRPARPAPATQPDFWQRLEKEFGIQKVIP